VSLDNANTRGMIGYHLTVRASPCEWRRGDRVHTTVMTRRVPPERNKQAL